jgi:hypothetical protein
MNAKLNREVSISMLSGVPFDNTRKDRYSLLDGNQQVSHRIRAQGPHLAPPKSIEVFFQTYIDC